MTPQQYATAAIRRSESPAAIVEALIDAHGLSHDEAAAIVARVRRTICRPLDESDVADVRSESVAAMSESLRRIDRARRLLDRDADRLETADDVDPDEIMRHVRAVIALEGAERVIRRDTVVAVVPRDVRQSASRLTDDAFVDAAADAVR